MMIASKAPCLICSMSLSRSLVRERSIQGLRLMSTQSICKSRPSVAQSCFKQLCISHFLGVPEKRYKTLENLLSSFGTVEGAGPG